MYVLKWFFHVGIQCMYNTSLRSYLMVFFLLGSGANSASDATLNDIGNWPPESTRCDDISTKMQRTTNRLYIIRDLLQTSKGLPGNLLAKWVWSQSHLCFVPCISSYFDMNFATGEIFIILKRYIPFKKMIFPVQWINMLATCSTLPSMISVIDATRYACCITSLSDYCYNLVSVRNIDLVFILRFDLLL